MTLIYLDDDQDDLELFELAAKPVEGINHIYTTTSHVSFFELLESNVPKETIVFLDINMPLMNGFSVLREIRGKSRFDPVVIVMHSTTSDKVSVSISRELGANYYSGKPDNFRQLQELIKTVVTSPEYPSDPSDFLINAKVAL